MIIDTPWMPRLVPTADLGGAVAASTAEVTAGTDNAKFITPAALEGSSPTLADLTLTGNLIASGTGTHSLAGALRLNNATESEIQSYTGAAYTPMGFNALAYAWKTSGGTAGMTLSATDELSVTGTGSHVFGTTNTVTLAAGAVTATGTGYFGGNVGIGTSAGSWQLRIQQAVTNSAVRIVSPAALGLGDSSLYLHWASGSKAVITASYETTGSYRPLVLSTGGMDSLTLGTTGNATFAGSAAFAGAAVSASTGIVTPVGTTALSSLRVPHGAAPTSPVDGDIWTTTAGLFVRVNGVTVGPLS